MQIFTWYQYVWNSWSPFTFRLKSNWEQPNYLSETQRGSGRQLASHKSPKRILTIHKKFEIFTPLQMLPDSWFTLQLLSELCENMLLQSRSWLCILFLTEQYFPHQEKEVIVLSLALEEVIGGTLFCSQSQVSRQSDVLRWTFVPAWRQAFTTQSHLRCCKNLGAMEVRFSKWFLSVTKDAMNLF